jgi:hypothetical protein
MCHRDVKEFSHCFIYFVHNNVLSSTVQYTCGQRPVNQDIDDARAIVPSAILNCSYHVPCISFAYFYGERSNGSTCYTYSCSSNGPNARMIMAWLVEFGHRGEYDCTLPHWLGCLPSYTLTNVDECADLAFLLGDG